MKSFTKGFAAGATALAVGVPLMAQMAFAASGDAATSSSAAAIAADTRPLPTQACVQAMADLETAHLAGFDQDSAERKAKMLARRDALVAAAAITDDAQRAEAMKAAHESMKPTEERTVPAAIQTAMDAVKTACGDTMMFKGGRGGPMGGHHGGPFMMKMKRAQLEGQDAVKEAVPAA